MSHSWLWTVYLIAFCLHKQKITCPTCWERTQNWTEVRWELCCSWQCINDVARFLLFKDFEMLYQATENKEVSSFLKMCSIDKPVRQGITVYRTNFDTSWMQHIKYMYFAHSEHSRVLSTYYEAVLTSCSRTVISTSSLKLILESFCISQSFPKSLPIQFKIVKLLKSSLLTILNRKHSTKIT